MDGDPAQQPTDPVRIDRRPEDRLAIPAQPVEV
jgi:hypothetical protein